MSVAQLDPAFKPYHLTRMFIAQVLQEAQQLNPQIRNTVAIYHNEPGLLEQVGVRVINEHDAVPRTIRSNRTEKTHSLKKSHQPNLDINSLFFIRPNNSKFPSKHNARNQKTIFHKMKPPRNQADNTQDSSFLGALLVQRPDGNVNF